MLNSKKKTGPIEFVFPILLFMIFTLSALFIILFAAQIYQKVVDNSSINYSANTALSYVSEKIRQADADGGVEIGDFHNCDALVLHNEINDTDYVTYIYFYEGSLYEVMTEKSHINELSAGAGTAIIDVENFEISEDDNHLISFRCTDSAGNSSSAMIAVTTK